MWKQRLRKVKWFAQDPGAESGRVGFKPMLSTLESALLVLVTLPWRIAIDMYGAPVLCTKHWRFYMFRLSVMIGLGRHFHIRLPDGEAEAQVYGVAQVA